MKKIIITENQFKSVVDNIINEASVDPVTGGEKKTISYSITNSFDSGQYKIKNTKDIDNALNSFQKFIGNNKGEFVIEIVSSESKVPNTSLGLRIGELSKLRGVEVETYIKSKNIPNVSTKITDLGAQGPEWNPKLGSKNEQYTKHQFVLLKLNADIINKGCIVDMEIIVDYKKFSNVTYQEHICDMADFKMFANGVPLNVVGRQDNIVSLNNGSDGGPRIVTLKINSEDAKKINQKDTEKIIFTLQCATDDYKGCHSDPIHVEIKNGQGKTVYGPSFITVGRRLKLGQSVVLLTTDKCGENPVVGSNEVIEPSQEFIDAYKKSKKRFNLQSGNEYLFDSRSFAEIYKFVDNIGVIKIPNDEFPYMDNFKKWNNKKWSDFIEFYSISNSQLKEITNITNNIKNSLVKNK